MQAQSTHSHNRGRAYSGSHAKPSNKKGFISFLSGKIVYLALFAAIIYIGVNFISQQPQINKMQSEMHEIQTSIEDANKENSRLKAEKKEMNTRAYKERMAREKLGLVKRGEKIFIDVNE